MTFAKKKGGTVMMAGTIYFYNDKEELIKEIDVEEYDDLLEGERIVQSDITRLLSQSSQRNRYGFVSQR